MVKKKDWKKSMKKNYENSWRYLKESKNYIYASILIFGVFLLLGFFVAVPPSIESMIKGFIDELVTKTQGMGFSQISLFIFWNNVQSSFLGMIYGALLGIFPVLALISNGYLLGYVASESVSAAGVSVLWRIFPHGIFELPALFISLGLGIKFGTFVFNKERIKTFKNYFWNSLMVFLFIVLPLLVVAALIESLLILFVG